MRQLKLFEGFPKGQRLRPGRRYQVAAVGAPSGGAGEWDRTAALAI